MTKHVRFVCAFSMLFGAALAVYAQPGVVPPPNVDERLERMSKLLVETQRQLERTQAQLNELRAELTQVRGDQAVAATVPDASSSSSLADEVSRLREQQDVVQSEIKQHDQTKLESMSKYPVRVYGLVLLNAYSNAGVVDNPDLPSIAIARTAGKSHGSVGGSLRQSLFGLSAIGPRVLGARSSANVSVDLFGDSSYSYYGSTNGSVRLRRADVRLAWGSSSEPEGGRDELRLGVDSPLISPLSPTSYATLAEAPLAWSGNLWNWAPQLQFKHKVTLSAEHPERTLQLEGGLWDPPATGVSGSYSSRVLSAGETSRRPGLLGRVSMHGGSENHAFAFGVGGYSDRQTYSGNQQIQMWAITGDWHLPLSNRFQLDGEIYRGRGLGGLGGGAYKDVLDGIDTKTGLSRTIGLNAVGGWSQLKARLLPGMEGNLIYGQDGGFAKDYHQVTLTDVADPVEQNARSQTLVANLIYRPRTYLILSPEYRRILGWKITGPAATANIYTLSLGYQF